MTFEVYGKKYSFGKVYHKLNLLLLSQIAVFLERLSGISYAQCIINDKKMDSSIWMNGEDISLIKRVIKIQAEESKAEYNDVFLYQLLDVMAYDENKKEWYPLVVYDKDTGLFDQREMDACIEIGSNNNPDFFVELLSKVWAVRLSQYDDMPSILKKKADDMMKTDGGLYTKALSQGSCAR